MWRGKAASDQNMEAMVNDTSAADRLTRLEQYLREDPNNLALLDEAFNAAFAAGEWQRARFHLRHAQALGVTGVIVDFRESRIDMAMRRWGDARARLETLAVATDLPSDARGAIEHDIAYTMFREGDFAGARDRLAAPMLANQMTSSPAMQVLWLRTLHQVGEIKQAVEWARARSADGTLASDAMGVASLAALDVGEMDLAQAWSAAALQKNGQQLEALVAAGTVALGRRDAAQAKELLRGALTVHAEDGRAWSAFGFAELLELQLEAALFAFHQAIRFMPGHVGTWNGLGWTQVVRRDMDAAVQAFQQAVTLDRNFGESHGGLAVAYALLGQREQAEREIARARGLDVDGLATRYASAILAGEVGDSASVQRLATQLLSRRFGSTGDSMVG